MGFSTLELLINGEQVTAWKDLKNSHYPYLWALMFFFFSNRKPKQFNYQPRYQKTKTEEEPKKKISFKDKSYSDAMYDRYERVPFADLKKAGKQRMMIKAAVLAVVFIILILYVDKIEELLKELE